MKIRKYICKFVDHERKTVHICMATVHCNRSDKWKYDEHDIEGFVEWACHFARHEKNIEMKISEFMKEKCGNIRHSDYTLCKKKYCKKSCNINVSEGNEVNVFREKYFFGKYIHIYKKGSKSHNKEDVTQYTLTEDIYNFNMERDDNDQIVLSILHEHDGKITIPTIKNEKATNYSAVNIVNNNTMNSSAMKNWSLSSDIDAAANRIVRMFDNNPSNLNASHMTNANTTAAKNIGSLPQQGGLYSNYRSNKFRAIY
jgi:hypothetical protein